ncbi:MAG: RDD family protein [Motiliproteus sp.]
MQKFPETPDQLSPAPLARRLAAMLYDSLLIAAIWMVEGAIAVALNGGEAVQGPLIKSILFLSAFLFFAGFWSRNGQTLGMQVWRLRVQTPQGYPISLMQALLRFFTAGLSILCLGIGYWWMLFDKQGLTWHDRYSETCIVELSKPIKR